MSEQYIRDLKRDADKAFKNGNFEQALCLSEELAGANVPSALFTCGLILEKGWIKGETDLDRALIFYRKLAIQFNDDEGYLGCVRIFLARRESNNKDKALSYCLKATNGRLKRLAFLLQGKVYEDLCVPPQPKLARKAYLKAFIAGSAWALREHATSLVKSNNVVGGVFMHIIATVCSPIMVLINGLRTTRRG